MGKEYKLSSQQITEIEKVLNNGDRVEMIPAKDRIKVIQEVRKEIK